MIRPNFFIVGAPKCGTTALYTYLNDHPNIFMPELKEPHFFADDYAHHRAVHSQSDYLALFQAASPEKHLAIGEASVHYIHSHTAIENLYGFDPQARIIAMFRNPIDMVYSFHSQAVFNLYDDEPDFEKAWRLQFPRQAGHHIPPTCREPRFLQYGYIGQLGTQAERLLAVFPREQVHFILFDDLASATHTVYENALHFLNVPPDGRVEFPAVNQNKLHRNAWLQQWLQTEPPPYIRKLQQAAGIRGSAVKKVLARWNTRTQKRPPLSSVFRLELVEAFRPEVEKLARVLDRDLAGWLR